MEYEKYQNEQLKALGLDPAKLTQAQKEIVLQPMEAPENYHHDGEVTNAQAKQIWRNKMKKAGFTHLQIFKAEKAIRL